MINDKHEAAQFDSKYMPGLHNRLIRYYFYLNRGLDMLNQSRNLFLGIFAAYFALKLDNVWILAAMFFPSVLLLMIAGYYSTHHMSKVLDWVGIRFGSHYAMKNYNLQEENVRLLAEIRDILATK